MEVNLWRDIIIGATRTMTWRQVEQHNRIECEKDPPNLGAYEGTDYGAHPNTLEGVALSWAVKAPNNMIIVSKYSPRALIFGNTQNHKGICKKDCQESPSPSR